MIQVVFHSSKYLELALLMLDYDVDTAQP